MSLDKVISISTTDELLDSNKTYPKNPNHSDILFAVGTSTLTVGPRDFPSISSPVAPNNIIISSTTDILGNHYAFNVASQVR